MKLSLIVPKHKGGGGTMFPFLPPLGLESIAVYIKNYFYFNDLEVEIFDENITPFSKIVDSLPRDGVVGISLWHSNAHRMNFFGRAAKEKNNIVVIGGPYTNGLTKRLTNCENVDYVVRGDGEEALFKILNNPKRRVGPRPVIIETKRFNVNQLPIIDFRHTRDLSKYAFMKPGGSFYDSLLPTAGIRGCIKATKYGRCYYCSSPYCKVSILKPQNFWKQIKKFQELYGICNFFETGDVFSMGQYPLLLAKTKPKGLKINLGVNERVDSINKEIYSESALQIGIKLVFIGIEHVNEEMLKNMGKNAYYDAREAERKIGFFKKLGIKVAPAFIFGGPGETKKTAEENLQFIEKIAEKFENIAYLTVSQFFPHPGTASFQMLAEKISEKIPIEELEEFDDISLSQCFTKCFCKIDWDDLQILIEKARLAAGNAGNIPVCQHNLQD